MSIQTSMINNKQRRMLLAGSALLLVGCGAAKEQASGPVAARDSAGIEIVDIPGNPWSSPPWATIDSARAFRIAPNPAVPATLFGRVRGALKLDDGHIVVLDAGNFEIRLYDKNGAFVKSVGRRGQGPGEFEQPWRILRGRGDSLVVAELMNGTIQVFSVASDSSRRLRIPFRSATGTAHLLGSFPDGDFLVIMNDLGHDPQPGRNPLLSSVHVMTAAGDSGVSLGKQISTEHVFKEGAGGRLEQVDNLFWAEPGWAGLSDSYVWCIPRRFECDIWSKHGARGESTGRHTRIIRAHFRGQSVGGAAYDELEKSWLRNALTQGDSARVRRRIAEGDRPEVFPILSLIRGDRKDRIWMREYLWSDSVKVARWLVFESTGKVLGTIALPADLWIYEIGADYILGTELDENDVQRVVMYPYSIVGSKPS